jgi:hypothetical protein
VGRIEKGEIKGADKDKMPLPNKLEDLDLNKLADTAFNMIVYRLSPVLGGRSEVLNTPVLEALDYLDMNNKERENVRMEQFQMLFFGANSRVDPKARKQFFEKLKPKHTGGRLLGKRKTLEWDYAALDEFRAKK